MRFHIWAASRTRRAHMTKTIALAIVPRVGEYVKFTNRELGDYFPWQVREVVYRESGDIDVMTELLDNIDDRQYSFEEETELDEFVRSYSAEGWLLDRLGPNTRYNPSK